MKISLLQPKIIRGNIEHNIQAIQRLINNGQGDLLVLPEYAVTGSLVLDKRADIREWTVESSRAKPFLHPRKGRQLLLNYLVEIPEGLFNRCELIPSGVSQDKLFPDPTEQTAGIQPGKEQTVFKVRRKHFKVLICCDLPHWEQIQTDGLDFILFIYHFGTANLSKVTSEVKHFSRVRNIRILVSSLVSDQNIGYTSYVDNDVVVSLPEQEGILEVEIG